jgi:hypothetical protein
MTRILSHVLLFCFLPCISLASTSPIVDRCAHLSSNTEKFQNCVLVEIKALGPPPTEEEQRVLYGEPDDPALVRAMTSDWAEHVLALQPSYLACRPASSEMAFYGCMSALANKEFELHEKLMESLKPQSWPKTLAERYTTTYATRTLIPAIMACDGKLGDKMSACLKSVLGRDPESLYSDGAWAYLKKAFQNLGELANQQRAVLAERDREVMRGQRDEIPGQRAYDRDLMEAYFVGQILQGLPFSAPFRNSETASSSPNLYTAPPALLIPSAPAQRPLPLVNCMINTVGKITHTSCY